jgi:dihydrofolate reductase
VVIAMENRNVVLYQLLSLDGVAEEPGNWFFDTGSEVFANLGRIIASQDDILLGRGTYDYWVEYWPTSNVEPFASFINGTRKHVATSSRLTCEWSNTTLVETPIVDYVNTLTTRAGGDIGIHGSIELARSLLRAGLVDELRLVVAPVVAGSGRRVFDGIEHLQTFELSDVDRTPQGTLLLAYQRVTPTTTSTR